MNNPSRAALKGQALTRAAAAIYRTLGAEVREDVSLAGSQVDLLLLLPEDGRIVRCAVQCKPYSKLVGVRTVHSFNSLVHFLKDRKVIDKAVLLSINGFTRVAHQLASQNNIELVRLSDLQRRLRGREQEVVKSVERGFQNEAALLSNEPQRRRVFVIMPFSKEFDDVYVLGIREVAERAGLVVERADDIEHNNQILEVIKEKIRQYELVVADTTLPNPNVYYEVGYAHAVGTPTILVTRSDQKLPFDLQSFNHIFYETIVDLRDKLEKRIRATLKI